jgi:hypothetical protein
VSGRLFLAPALAGRRLAPLPHANPFRFAWAAFEPEALIVG